MRPLAIMMRLVAWAFLMLSCIAPICCAESLEGKVALITGASSGIGAIVAKELAKKGMKVVLTARRASKLEQNVQEIKAAGGEAVAKECDVSNSVSIQWAFAFAEEYYGGIDFVFANAGIEGQLFKTGLTETDDKELQSLFDINVVGAAETLKYAVLAFEKRGGGTIAFSSSIAAFCGDVCRMVVNSLGVPRGSGIGYMATKAALDMVAEGAHGAYHDKGVKVYNLNIAEFASEMGTRLGFEQDNTPFNPIFKNSLGNPIHIAEALIAILDGSSKWPAGTSFMIDNDATVHAKYFYDKRKEPGPPEHLGWRSPEELKKVAMDVKGEPYKFKDEL